MQTVSATWDHVITEQHACSLVLVLGKLAPWYDTELDRSFWGFGVDKVG